MDTDAWNENEAPRRFCRAGPAGEKYCVVKNCLHHIRRRQFF